MFWAKRGESFVRNKIFSFGCRNDAPIHQRRKPAAAAAREVIERKVGFQKNEVELQGREEVTKEKGWEISWRAAKKSDWVAMGQQMSDERWHNGGVRFQSSTKFKNIIVVELRYLWRGSRVNTNCQALRFFSWSQRPRRGKRRRLSYLKAKLQLYAFVCQTSAAMPSAWMLQAKNAGAHHQKSFLTLRAPLGA